MTLQYELTDFPSARQALSLLLVPPQVGDKESPPKPAIEFFDQLEIYPGKHIDRKFSDVSCCQSFTPLVRLKAHAFQEAT